VLGGATAGPKPKELLSRIGASLDLDAPVKVLRMVENTPQNARVLILDEPAASLSQVA
jgi:ABC-type sugar transport system ATPase subunit